MDYYTPQNGKDLTILNLLPNTVYSYTITLTDFSGNSVTTQAETFQTPLLESEPPKIMADSPIHIGADQATIRIQTNKALSRALLTVLPADTGIPQEFSFGSSTNFVREFTLTGLRPGVSYYYYVTVIDVSGNVTRAASYGEFHTKVI